VIGEMRRNANGRKVIARGRLVRFHAAHDRDYGPIREMASKAEGVSLI